ncbi:MAG: hypothetical protein QOI95_15 [Acidimicrobiaceae bacterium]
MRSEKRVEFRELLRRIRAAHVRTSGLDVDHKSWLHAVHLADELRSQRLNHRVRDIMEEPILVYETSGDRSPSQEHAVFCRPPQSSGCTVSPGRRLLRRNAAICSARPSSAEGTWPVVIWSMASGAGRSPMRTTTANTAAPNHDGAFSPVASVKGCKRTSCGWDLQLARPSRARTVGMASSGSQKTVRIALARLHRPSPSRSSHARRLPGPASPSRTIPA